GAFTNSRCTRAHHDGALLSQDPVHHSTGHHRRLRVSDYRVVYTLDNGALVVWVVQVGHRSTTPSTTPDAG
ncbi:type II toxin-antitoxin system RelE/ParE family toxin, partial [Streptomyces sp. NPDC060031]|uniref:type II toxin-antitoxin system RelE family toxin n=1 Tax=Streptomyces sp. NPDC060031 TaxID=3347043 RepID=UPI00369299E5